MGPVPGRVCPEGILRLRRSSPFWGIRRLAVLSHSPWMGSEQVAAASDMYDFDLGLAQVERLEVLIASPLLAAVTPDLPVTGEKTKRSSGEAAALIVVGAATLICGSDRAATRELRAHWPRLRAAFDAAGIRVSGVPLGATEFRTYRDDLLGGALPESVKKAMRELFVGLALELGLFPKVDAPWNEPDPDGVPSADGTWVKAYAEAGGEYGSASDAVSGDADRFNAVKWKGNRGRKPSKDAERRNKTSWGYNFCIVSVRGDGKRHRQRVVLDIARAVDGDELAAAVPAFLRLKGCLGDRLRCVVYDGAMRGTHHLELRAAGMVTVNKPRGIRKLDQWKQHCGTRLGKSAKVFELPISCRCDHLFNVVGGMMWEARRTPLGLTRAVEPLPVTSLDRHGPDGDGVYSWTMKLRVPCSEGDHVVEIDPNATLPSITVKALQSDAKRSRAKTNLAEDLRMVQMRQEVFRPVYGRRNDSESGNKTLKTDYGHGKRAKSVTAARVDFDLWMFALLHNALVLREHQQLKAEARAAQRAQLLAQLESERDPSDEESPRRSVAAKFAGLRGV